MEKLKSVFRTKAALCLALCLFLVAVAIIGGATYARYQWEFKQASYFFSSANNPGLTVYGAALTQQTLDSGTLPDTKAVWKQTGDGAALTFSVTNGKPDAFFQQEQVCGIRLSAGLTVEDPTALTVILSYTDEKGNPVSVVGEPVAIAAGSFQHSAFGDGWTYKFCSKGTELRFTLSGDAFDYRNFTIHVTGEVPATLLELQVTQIPAE